MNPERIYLRYGVIVAIVLIAYFLIVKLFGWHENPWLRLLNGLVMAYGIYASIRMRKLLEGDRFNYYNGFRTGLFTGVVTSFIFVGFMAVYMFHLDPGFPDKIMGNWVDEYKQGPGILLFVLLVEGLASAVVLTLAFMQKFKTSWNTTKKVA